MDFRSLLMKMFNKYPPIVKIFGMKLSFDEDNHTIITHGTRTFLIMASKEQLLKKIEQHDK